MSRSNAEITSLLKVNIAGIEMNTPVIAASGTFGFGEEYDDFVDWSVSCPYGTGRLVVPEVLRTPARPLFAVVAVRRFTLTTPARVRS